ncbi:capZ-interacting protein [Silurus meridionalis]|uniref:FAM21/CAPZIP domain-containing protein n=1 Tax=Silurus meridionalis TaxID=175797 RepID=A0A8T0B1Y2_SILME|nr:capZ-interacting protein [Silurus meridionalis]KAF7700157.1 hypothetical protein HF521_003115 [Silurus meridionalis]
MEEASPVKLSVAELAGKFKSHPLPMPRSEERKPVQRSPPCSLQLHGQTDSESEKEKTAVTPQPPPKTKLKNSPLIEKLQAIPILTPSILLNSTKGPEGKQQAAPFCAISPCCHQSPNLRPPQQLSENEVPISFEQPAEGTTLPNINKCRVRLSFKRRPPTRPHRKSTGDEGVSDTPEENRSPCDPNSPDTPDKNDSTKDALNVFEDETQENQEDSTPPITVQDTELQEELNDVTKDNEGSGDTEGENKEEVAEEKIAGNPETSGDLDNPQVEKALEEQSKGETECAKKEDDTAGESTEENLEAGDQNQDPASGD